MHVSQNRLLLHISCTIQYCVLYVYTDGIVTEQIERVLILKKRPLPPIRPALSNCRTNGVQRIMKWKFFEFKTNIKQNLPLPFIYLERKRYRKMKKL